MRRFLRLILLALVLLSSVAVWLFLRHLRHPPPWWAIIGVSLVCLGLLLWAMGERNGQEDPPDPPQ